MMKQANGNYLPCKSAEKVNSQKNAARLPSPKPSESTEPSSNIIYGGTVDKVLS